MSRETHLIDDTAGVRRWLITEFIVCTATRHDTAVAHRHQGCRCPEALRDVRRQAKLGILEARTGQPRRVPAENTQRQIRALMAGGWPGQEIAHRIGWEAGNIRPLLRDKYVLRRTAIRVDQVYRELITVAGPSDITRRRAAKADWWLPPVEATPA